MSEAILFGFLAFGVTFVGLMVVERFIHKLTRNKDRSYRWGVWTFAILAGAYACFTSLGR
jgi:hypothetical protein